MSLPNKKNVHIWITSTKDKSEYIQVAVRKCNEFLYKKTNKLFISHACLVTKNSNHFKSKSTSKLKFN